MKLDNDYVWENLWSTQLHILLGIYTWHDIAWLMWEIYHVIWILCFYDLVIPTNDRLGNSF